MQSMIGNKKTLAELIKLDKSLRALDFSIICGPWDEDNPYFSIGEDDNNFIYKGKLPEKEEGVLGTKISNEDKKRLFLITHIKDETESSEVLYQKIDK